MIRHIVYWCKKPETTLQDLNNLKEMLLDLKNKIDIEFDLDYHISNIDTNSFDVMLDSHFKSFEDLKYYSNHKSHLEFVSVNNKYVTNRCAFDYEY